MLEHTLPSAAGRAGFGCEALVKVGPLQLKPSVLRTKAGTSVKLVFQGRDVAEAELVRSLLDSVGIGAVVQGDDPWGARDDVGQAGAAPSVLVVNDSDEEEAVDIVAAYRQAGELPAGAGWSWRCTHCGQESEPQFGTCWKCGADRSGWDE